MGTDYLLVLWNMEHVFLDGKYKLEIIRLSSGRCVLFKQDASIVNVIAKMITIYTP